jgi:hypothetical protein
MLLGRPTNKGMTMCGKTTTSRNGNKGSSRGVAGSKGCPDMVSLPVKKGRVLGTVPE